VREESRDKLLRGTKKIIKTGKKFQTGAKSFLFFTISCCIFDFRSNNWVRESIADVAVIEE
jgi:hypothetical protein